MMFFISLILYYILKPCREFICKMGYKKNIVSMFLVSIIMITLVVIVVLILPSILNQSGDFHKRLKEIDQILKFISKEFEGITKIRKVNEIITEGYQYFDELLHDFGIKIIEIIIEFGKKTIIVLAIPIITYYMLSDYENTVGKLVFLIPVSIRKDLLKISKDIDKVLRKYIIGQILLSSMMGIFITIILYIMGVKYAIYFGIINGIFNLIPYVGPLIASIPIILVSFSKSINTGIMITIFLMVIQQIEGDIVSPKVLGKFIEFHPLLIIFLLLIGGKIGGIIGMFLVIPISIAIRIIFEEIDYILIKRK